MARHPCQLLYPSRERIYAHLETFSKYPFVYKALSTTAQPCHSELQYLISQYRPPMSIFTENRSPFSSEDLARCVQKQQIDHITSLPHILLLYPYWTPHAITPWNSTQPDPGTPRLAPSAYLPRSSVQLPHVKEEPAKGVLWESAQCMPPTRAHPQPGSTLPLAWWTKCIHPRHYHHAIINPS